MDLGRPAMSPLTGVAAIGDAARSHQTSPASLERRRRSIQDHAPIASHSPPPQRPGGPGAAPLGKLGLPVHQPRAIRRSSTTSSSKARGLWRDAARSRSLENHRVEIKLGASYPRTIPEIRWLTPIYHPNISEIGMVCLGGYGTHWVPSVQLDELCMMLWDMARYHNYDIRSPYNRDAALWVANQTTIRFPTDARPLRDLRAGPGPRRSLERRSCKRKSTGSAGDSSGRSSRAGQPSTNASGDAVGTVAPLWTGFVSSWNVMPERSADRRRRRSRIRRSDAALAREPSTDARSTLRRPRREWGERARRCRRSATLIGQANGHLDDE